MHLIKDFLKSKEIYLLEKKAKRIDYNKLEEKEIINHLNLLASFHKRVSDNKGVVLLNINSEIGKQYETYKVILKRFKRNYLKLKKIEENNSFSQAVIKYGEKIIEKGIDSIAKIKYENYIELIKRSMRKNEICLGNPFLENVYGHKKIYINNIDNISFNLVENDVINFTNKLIKKRVKVNLKNLISAYLKQMNLDEKSEEYIKAMIDFPIEVIKIFDRKIYNKKEWSDEEASKKFMLAVEKLNI